MRGKIQILGMWPLEATLKLWVRAPCKCKGTIDLKLIGSKGFFKMVFFSCEEDKENVFDSRPYFFNSTGMYMRYWVKKFDPKNEYFLKSLVWIIMYSM
jgi:hypothetical protein